MNVEIRNGVVKGRPEGQGLTEAKLVALSCNLRMERRKKHNGLEMTDPAHRFVMIE